MAGPKVLEAFAEAYPEAFFVEIGSNDGEKHDHLRPLILSRSWRGVMVEPVPYVFAGLRRNYGDIDRVTLENVAIADRDGELPFFHLREAGADERERLPEWYDGIGSFSEEAVLGHAAEIPDIESRLVRTAVPSLTFDSLCRRRGIDRVDLLLVDTEGYDWELLRSIDLARVRPRLVVYEHFHLSPDDRRDCRERFAALGYLVMEEGFDTFCLDPREDPLTDRWRALRPAVAGVSAHGS
jgi:FkbM family methyltransferase